MNYFLKEAAIKAAILDLVSQCTALGITGEELTEGLIDMFHPMQVGDVLGLAIDIKRLTRKLAAQGKIIEEIRETEYDGTVYCRYLYWPLPKVSDK